MLRGAVQDLVSLRRFCAGGDAALAVRAWAAGLHSLAAEHSAGLNTQPAGGHPGAAAAAAARAGGAQTQREEVAEEDQLLVQVGVVGVPNAGKSTLTNAVVGSKISAVSAKTNTTVHSTLGALTEGAAQLVMYDTPGVVGPSHFMNPRHERRVRSAWTMAAGCDLLLLIVDAHRQLAKSDPRVLRLIAEYGSGKAPAGLSGAPWSPPPSILVLNKVDMLHRDQRPALLGLADRLAALHKFEEIFWVSALRGHGIEDLRQHLLSRATPGKWAVESHATTDRSQEEVALEVVREKIFRTFYDEVPYELDVVPVSFKTLFDGSLRVEHDVMVASDSVRKIVVGTRGAAIGTVGRGARLELEKMWKRRVHLILNAKVVKK